MDLDTPQVTPLPRLELTPGYYRAAKNDGNIKKGELVYLTRLIDEEVHFLQGDESYTMDAASFLAAYEPAPDGLRERQEQMASLMTEIANIEQQHGGLTKQLAGFSPHVNALGQVETGGAALVVASEPSAMTVIKRSVAEMRNGLLKFNKSIRVKTEQFQLLAKEQANILAAKANELGEMVKKAEEVVWTINLYLGQKEEVLRLAKGKPAPAETPISIRQLVLFMDEECAVASDSGGIDARSIEEFDKWLVADPAHLDQVLPEEKGIVALKPRRYHRDYGDPWVNKDMAEKNKATYFLMRNGSNLYRIWTEYNVGHTLVPTQTEFMDILYDDDWDWQTHRRIKKPLEPGSAAYMRKMKEVDARQRHYLRVCLIIQGLLDRTAIFRPLPAPRVNICNRDDYDRFLRFIYDAENLLGDGRPDFADWLFSTNSQLTKGERIIGIFNNYDHGLSRRDDHDGRVWPARASLPQDLALYTLAERVTESDKTAYYIYYQRGEVYRPGYDDQGRWKGYGEAKVRARCTVYPGDKFILAFDRASVNDMTYYLGSRQHRHHYTHMFPLLKRAIKLKQQEAKDEEPFIQLLSGQIAKVHRVSHTDADAAVPELVHWWKFKNQTHRALTSDDKLALKMIVDEFGIRRKRKVERQALVGFERQVVDYIKEHEPDTILVAHKKGNEYVALVAATTGNVWVHELTYKSNRSSNNLSDKLREAGRKEWTTVDRRYERWQVIYTAECWAGWAVGASRYEHLTEPEINQVFQRGLELIEDRYQQERTFWRDRNEPKSKRRKSVYWCLGACLDNESRIHVYLCDFAASIPKLALGNRAVEPQIAHVRLDWRRAGSGKSESIKVELADDCHICLGKVPPWRPDYDGVLSCARNNTRILREWPENIARVEEGFAAHRAFEKAQRALEAQRHKAIESVNEHVTGTLEAQAYGDYLAEHGDPELWDDHKRKHPIRGSASDAARDLLAFLIDRNKPINGHSLAALRQLALDLGWKADNGQELGEAELSAVIKSPPEDCSDEDCSDEDD